MLKRIFTITNAFFLAFATLGSISLTSCSSGSSEETKFAGIMTVSEFASGQQSFLVANSSFLFFIINSNGGVDPGASGVANEVVVDGNIDVDGREYPITMIYKTDETLQPDGLPTTGELTISLQDPSDETDDTLMDALFSTQTGNNPALKGEPIQLQFDFTSGIGSLESTIEIDGTADTDDGNIIITRTQFNFVQEISFNIISSATTPI